MTSPVFASLFLLITGLAASSAHQAIAAHDHHAADYLSSDQDSLHHDFSSDQDPLAPEYLLTNQLFGKRQLAVPAEFLLPDDLNLGTITLQAVDQFLGNKPAVLRLVHCFMDESKCLTKGEINFAGQIKRLGRGGQCFRCTPKEQANIKNIMRRTIAAMQKLYPAEWNSLVPILRNLF